MNFGGKQNNRTETNVNTSATSYRNTEGSSPSAMNVGYWNSMISIKLHPPLPENQRNNENFFNYEAVISTAMTIEKTIVVLEAMKNIVVPALKAGETSFRGTEIGTNGLVGVGTTKEGDKTVAYFGIFKALDPDTRKPAEFAKYHFKTTTAIDDYNPETGEYTFNAETGEVQSEVHSFIKLLESSLVGLFNSTVHADRYVNKFFRDKLNSKLDEIGGKLGIQPQQRSFGNGGNYNRNGNGGGMFNQSSNTPASVAPPGQQAPVESINNIDELDGFL